MPKWGISKRHRFVAAAVLACFYGRAGRPSRADVANAPSFSSRPGAAYTIYLDFAGFSFSGTWGNSTYHPGVTPGYDGTTTTFSNTDLANIKNIWARTAEKYAPFNVNVTTVDPAAVAGDAISDATRQAFYDSSTQIMHTVVGGTGGWIIGGGVSYVGRDSTAQTTTLSNNSGASAGYHTDFVFSDQNPTNLAFVGESAAHENGHGFGLQHQSDVTDGKITNEYSTDGHGMGAGAFSPIMGTSYYTTRGTWRIGNADDNGTVVTQNDVQVIANAHNNSFVDDGIGHSMGTASNLSLTNSAVDFTTDKGVIIPASATTPTAIGVNNYTTDFFKFTSTGASITLTAHDGSELIAPGTADPGATLESTLTILDSTGNTAALATMADDTMSETFAGALPPGTYYAEVASYGGYQSTYDPKASYYTIGSFFLTGGGMAVPEPGVMTIFLIPLLMLRRNRRCNRRLSD